MACGAILGVVPLRGLILTFMAIFLSHHPIRVEYFSKSQMKFAPSGAG
jgi:hypothetical protein